MNIPGTLGYSDDPRMFLGPPVQLPSVWVSQDSYSGILIYTIPGCSFLRLSVQGPLCLSIPECSWDHLFRHLYVWVSQDFPGYSDDPRMFLGLPVQRPWVHVSKDFQDTRTIPGCSREPPVQLPFSLSIPRFSGYLDDPRMFLGPPTSLSEYPKTPGILGRSQDVLPLCLSIPGFPGYSEDPRMPLSASIYISR